MHTRRAKWAATMAGFVTMLALMGAASSCGPTSSTPQPAPHPSRHSTTIVTPDAPCATAGAKGTGLDGVTYVCARLVGGNGGLMWLPSDTAGNTGPTAHATTTVSGSHR